MAKNKSYMIGYFLAAFAIWSLYLAGVVGCIVEIKNGTFPFVPLIFMFAISTWRKSLHSNEILKSQGYANALFNSILGSPKKTEDEQIVDKLFPKTKNFGGPN